MKGLYNPEIVKGDFQSKRIGPMAGMDTYMDQNVQAHTRGTAVDTNALINGTITAATGDPGLGQDITTDGWGASVTTIKAGDIVTFAGVYGVNPVSYQSTGELQEFVITADVSTTVTTGVCTINVVPALITSGSHQTVTNVPADNAVIDLYGTASTAYPQNLAFNRSAFALVTCPLEVPDDANGAAITYKDVSIRYIKWYDGKTDKQIYRLDILYGWEGVYADYAGRLWGWVHGGGVQNPPIFFLEHT